jgi:hypothetical protein
MRHDLRSGSEWSFGVRVFDEATLGGARGGQLVTIIGRSHTGKTLLALNMVARNRNHRTLWVSPDETETMFWGRYAAIRMEIDQKDWIGRLIREDPTAWERVEQLMRDETNLHFESTGMTVDDIDKAMRIAVGGTMGWATTRGAGLRLLGTDSGWGRWRCSQRASQDRIVQAVGIGLACRRRHLAPVWPGFREPWPCRWD